MPCRVHLLTGAPFLGRRGRPSSFLLRTHRLGARQLLSLALEAHIVFLPLLVGMGLRLGRCLRFLGLETQLGNSSTFGCGVGCLVEFSRYTRQPQKYLKCFALASM